MGDIDNVKGVELALLAQNINNLNFSREFIKDLIKQDLIDITKEYPNQVFVVGSYHDSYQILADLYWGSDIKEFVSIQDYILFFANEPTISKKEYCSNVHIRERRDICASIWIRKAFNDDTDYNSIRYGISEENVLEGFRLVKQYRVLSLFEKTPN